MWSLVTILMLLAPFAGVLSSAQAQEIPALTKELAREIISFEVGDLKEGELEILEVRQFQEQARVRIRLRGAESEIRFECRKTDFGPRWRPLDLSTALKQEPIPEPAPPAAKKAESAPVTTPVEQLPDQQEFLRAFVTALQHGDEAALERMYYRDGDFDLAKVRSASGAPLAELAEKRAQFLRTCRELNGRLSAFRECTLVTVFAGQSSAAAVRQAQAIMPGAVRYLPAVSIEIMLDGQLGSMTCEGMTLFADGWRIGGFTDVELPESGR